jgi:hypothetical protein
VNANTVTAICATVIAVAADRRKGFTEADYARLLDAAHQQLAGPLVVVWDNLNAPVSGATGPASSAASSPAPGSTSHPSVTARARGWRSVGDLRPGAGLSAGAAFVQPCEARAVGFEHVRFGRCPVVVGR